MMGTTSVKDRILAEWKREKRPRDLTLCLLVGEDRAAESLAKLRYTKFEQYMEYEINDQRCTDGITLSNKFAFVQNPDGSKSVAPSMTIHHTAVSFPSHFRHAMNLTARLKEHIKIQDICTIVSEYAVCSTCFNMISIYVHAVEPRDEKRDQIVLDFLHKYHHVNECLPKLMPKYYKNTLNLVALDGRKVGETIYGIEYVTF